MAKSSISQILEFDNIMTRFHVTNWLHVATLKNKDPVGTPPKNGVARDMLYHPHS